MIVVSRKSWHYRFYQWGQHQIGNTDAEPKTLCGYFWTTVLILPGVFMAKIGLATLWGIRNILSLGDIPAAIIFSSTTTLALTSWAFMNIKGLLVFLLIIGIMVGLFAVAVLLMFLLDLAGERRARRHSSVEPTETSTPSLVWAMVKAKKQRACPTIVVR